jgi:hypothetical protein
MTSLALDSADGWNTDGATGEAIPGTDAGAAVAPDGGGWGLGPQLETE